MDVNQQGRRVRFTGGRDGAKPGAMLAYLRYRLAPDFLELFLLHTALFHIFTQNISNNMSDSDSEGGVPLIEAEFDVTANSKKRKAEADPEGAIDSKKEKAKRKQKKQAKAKNIDEDDLDQELGVNHAFERMDGQLVADYINARTRLYGKDLSSVELEDKFIPGEYYML
jgi:hypothetical protein